MAKDDEVSAQWPDFPYDPIAKWLEVQKGDKVRYFPSPIGEFAFLFVGSYGKEFDWSEVPFDKMRADMALVNGDSVLYGKTDDDERFVGMVKSDKSSLAYAADALAAAMRMRDDDDKVVFENWPKIPLTKIAEWLQVSDGDKVKYEFPNLAGSSRLSIPKATDNKRIFTWPDIPREKVKTDQKLEEGMNVGYSNAFGGRKVYIIRD